MSRGAAPLSTIGPYRVIRELGKGGMGMVYEAVHSTIERRVAIKLLNPEYARDPDATSRFFNEARAVNLIDHPSIVQISDYGQLPDGTAFIVMELLKGESLATHLRRVGKLSVAAALQIIWQVAAALTVTHEKRIVHRDLKPDNIMLIPDPLVGGGVRAKLLDFGIAKLAQANRTTTGTDAVMGTPQYMSPEQCKGAGEVDERTDVYSLGLVLFEMLTGRPAFVADAPWQLIGMHLFQAPPKLTTLMPAIPVGVADFVGRLLRKEKEQRPSMRKVQGEIEGLLSSYKSTSGFLSVVPNSVPDSDETSISGTSSTLGRAAGQSALRSSWATRRILLGFGGIALLGALGLVIVRLLPTSGQVPVQDPSAASGQTVRAATRNPVPTASPTAPPARRVRWLVTTQPSGAEVLGANGESLGSTPWQSTRGASDGVFSVRLRKSGYEDRVIQLDQNANEKRQELLNPRPSAVSKKKPAPPPPKATEMTPRYVD